jgi:DeoR family transcriptional regulator, glycerol-3-phosphate regulon repressor
VVFCVISDRICGNRSLNDETSPMLSKRHGEILKLLELQGSASIAALARQLDVSTETIRRDIRPLVESGSIVRIHGAVGIAGQLGEAPFERRMREHATAKKAIARHLAATIHDGDTLMLDTGTTTSFLARALIGHRRLTVVTNSSDIARTLATVNGNRVYMAGGELRSDSGAAFGSSAVEFVSRFFVQHAIISAGAIDATGVMDFDLQEAEFARTVLSRGQRKVVVSDASKFGCHGFVKVCDLGTIHELITDEAPAGSLAAALDAASVSVVVART